MPKFIYMLWHKDDTDYHEHEEAFQTEDIANYPEPQLEKIVDARHRDEAAIIGHGYAFLGDWTREDTWSRVHEIVSNVPERGSS